MGGCCYTPRRTDFLWWYWLVLTFVFCVPMTLAALVVKRARNLIDTQGQPATVDSQQLRKRSRQAFKVFLVAWMASTALALVVGWFVIRQWEFCTFGLGFAGGLMLTTAAVRASLRARGWPVLVLFLGLWVALWFVGWEVFPIGMGAPQYRRMTQAEENAGLLPQQSHQYEHILSFPPGEWLPAAFLTFIACILPAHFWQRFSESPTRSRGVHFLLALAGGCLVFWVFVNLDLVFWTITGRVPG